MKKSFTTFAMLAIIGMNVFLTSSFVTAQTAYITNEGSANVYVIDVATGITTDIISTGTGTNPYGVTVS